MEVKLTKKQAKLTKDLATLRRSFGQSGDEIADCLNVLKAADTLQELLSLSSALNHRCHELHKNLKDTFSMDLVHPYRLLFRPEEPIPRRSDNGIDYVQVRIVAVKELYENTHE